MSTHTIIIDLDLHKTIESHRRSLDETQTDIVRRVLRAGNGAVPSPAASEPLVPRSRLSRRGGTYRLRILGSSIEIHSLKEALKEAILFAEKTEPGFIEKLAQHRTSRGRRIVARKPEELYPGRPQLVETHAEQLNAKWWYDTNISRAQCRRYLGAIAEIGGFAEPELDEA